MEHPSEGNEFAEKQLDKPLTPFQLAALEALMEGKSIAEAAEAAGVSYRTVERWRDEHPAFKAEYNRWLRDKSTTLRDRLMSVAEESVELMVEAVRKKKDLSVAKSIVKDLGLAKPVGKVPTTAAGVANQMKLEQREQEMEIKERDDLLNEQEIRQFLRQVKRRQRLEYFQKQQQVLDGPPGAA